MLNLNSELFQTAKTVKEATELTGLSETTIREWLKRATDEGLIKNLGGRPATFERIREPLGSQAAAPSSAAVIQQLADQYEKRPALVRRVLRGKGFSHPYSDENLEAYRDALTSKS